mmetsp:Transcript_55453/g.154550  ORF Transcript_55453/g.154550 Transcript_55453/m.154550 type:complete len:221 (+) Transcript_55453:882-1544(+)
MPLKPLSFQAETQKSDGSSFSSHAVDLKYHKKSGERSRSFSKMIANSKPSWSKLFSSANRWCSEILLTASLRPSCVVFRQVLIPLLSMTRSILPKDEGSSRDTATVTPCRWGSSAATECRQRRKSASLLCARTTRMARPAPRSFSPPPGRAGAGAIDCGVGASATGPAAAGAGPCATNGVVPTRAALPPPVASLRRSSAAPDAVGAEGSPAAIACGCASA